ncbi:translocation/assembly module TamB domain-containing protein [Frigoriflavimonas asaccharolytica]
MNGKKIAKITGIAVASIIVLLILLVLSLQIPAVQNFAKGKLVNYLEDKIKTDVSLERIYIDFPSSLVMEKLYLKGQKQDTLLYVKKLDVGIDLLQLVNSKADITSIDLETVRANVVRDKSGKFNFDYILDAFATKDEEESTSKPFIISLDKIKIKDLGVNFTDNQARNDIKFYVKSFDTRVQKFDLDKNNFAVNNINVDGLKLKLKQDLVEEIAKKTEKTVDSMAAENPFKIALNRIKLTNFDIDYGDDISKTYSTIKFQELSTKINQLDLENSQFNVDNVLLKGANIDAKLFLAATKKANTENISSPKTESKPMQISLRKLLFEDVKLVYNNTAEPIAPAGMDFNHLNFSKMNVEVRNFKMIEGTFAGTVNSAEIQESRGLNIQKFNTDFVYEDKQAYLKDLYLQTPQTVLKDELVLNYNSIEQLSAKPGKVEIMANIANSKIGFKDILLFAPDLRKQAPFNKYPNGILNVDARLKGFINDLTIDNLQVSGLDKMKLALSGKIKNATDPSKLFYNLNIREFSTSARTIFNVVPKGTIPTNIALPSSISLNGVAKGTTQVVNTNMKLTSTLGNAKIDAKLDMRKKNAEQYNVIADLQNLQIGKIIQNKDLGIITGKIVANGTGFDPNKGIADVKGNIAAVDYNKYRYRNMNLKAKVNRGNYIINLDSKDPNANLAINASGRLTDKDPSVKVAGNIIKLDLNKLGFYAEPMILAGKLDGDFQSLNPDALNGELTLQNFAISDTKTVFPVQEVYLKAVSTESSNSISLQSQIADLEMNGKFKLSEIFGSLSNTINEYYHFQKAGKKAKITAGQFFTVQAQIKDDDLLRKFVPELTSFDNIDLTANYDADSQKLIVNGTIPKVVYGGNTIENGTLNINNENNALQYDVTLGKFATESLALNKVKLNGNLAEDVISYNLTTQDQKDVEQFLIAGTAKTFNDITEISLNPDGLKLNYDNWAVSPNNKLQISSKGFYADQFTLSNAGSEISLQSESTQANSPMNVSIKDFKIETITEMLKKDSLLAKGTVNGTAQLRNITKKLNFDANIDVADLEVFGNPAGNLNLKANNKTADVINTNIALTGFNNDVKIIGDYNTATSRIDADLVMNRLEMQTLQGFTANAIENTEGYLNGNLKINGTADAPNILGQIKFNNVGLEIVKIGSNFRNLNDPILFTNKGIKFNDFKVNDPSGNSLVFDGNILTTNYKDYAFDLDLNAKDFNVVDSEENKDNIMYGKLAIDAALKIRGDMNLPKVNGDLSVVDNTDFTFILPSSSPSLQDRDGVVEFIDQDQVALNGTIKQDSINADTGLKGLDVNVNIAVSKEAKMSIIIDKANGDFVALQGTANLNGGIDPSGKTTLTGVYEVEKGSYEMSVSLLKRKFDIQKGSTITWTGEPTSAQMDITAIYKTDAAPLDLLQQQLSEGDLNQYKQRIPFETLLILKGELLKPEISFDITTNKTNSSVSSQVLENTEAKLAQLRTEPSELNKQVFALLLLNRFIGEDPFSSSTGLSGATLAKQSVSRILSEQLNNLASDLIGGVELNFDLESSEDYSTGTRNERTDLNVGISKRLLNDRLTVSVGSNFGVEGEARANEKTSSIAGDVTIDYALSKDGRYKLRAYRKNQYQVSLQGQVIETGVGFILTIDYNKFREIFQRSKVEKENKKIEKTSSSK